MRKGLIALIDWAAWCFGDFKSTLVPHPVEVSSGMVLGFCQMGVKHSIRSC